MANKIITIDFKAIGDQKLIQAIDKLDAVSKKLISTQQKLQNTATKEQRQQQKRIKEILKLRNSLTKLKTDFTQAGISTKTYTAAVNGSKLALIELRTKTAQHIEQVKRYNSSLGRATNSTRKYNDVTKKTIDHTRILGGSMAVLRSKLLVFNFAMSLGIRQLGKFATEAAKLDAMESAFNTLSGGGTIASDAIDKLTKATEGTVSKMDLFQQANNAMILGVSNNADEMAEMFDMAQRLGDALGRDAKSSIESLITGIGRQSRMMLDNIGIIVKAEEAYKAYAEELKKDVDDLTNLERKQAFLNATIDSAREKVSKLPPEVMNARKTFQVLSAEVDNATVRIGEHFTPVAVELSQTLIKLSKAIDTESINAAGIAFTTTAISLATYKLAVLAATYVMNGFAISTGLATGGLSLLSGALITAGLHAKGLFRNASDETRELQEKADELKEEIDLLSTSFENNATSTDIFTASQKRAMEVFDNYIGTIGDEIVSLKMKKAALMGANDVDIIKLQLGDEFIKQNPKLIKLLEEEFEAVEKLELEKKKKELQDKNEIKNLKKQIREKEKLQRKEKADLEKLQNDRKSAMETIFKDDIEFQLKQLDLQAEQFRSLKLGAEAELQITKWLNDQKATLYEDHNSKIIAENKKLFDEMENARAVVLEDNLEFQLAELEIQKTQYEQLLTSAEDRVAIETWYQEQRRELTEKSLEENNLGYQLTLDSYDAFVKAMMDKDINFLEGRELVLNALKESLIKFIAEYVKEQIKQMLLEKAIRKAGEKAAVASAQTTGAQILAAYSGAATASATATFGGAAVAGGAAMKAVHSWLESTAVARDGGLIGGRRHSQGGTLIEAEQGEFIMSRNAVESIGIDKLANMNRGGSAGITININGNMIGNESFVRDTLIPEISKTVNEGLA